MHDAAAFDIEIDRLNRARSVEEAKRAMRDLGMFAQNLMFADAQGNAWYVRAGRAPVRPAGFDWSRPVPGNSSATAWQGLHPLDDLVQVTNPTQGYMQNNNVSPDQMTQPPGPINAEDYPNYLFNDEVGRSNPRGDRANEVLSQARRFTVEDAIDLALDEKWTATSAWIKALAQAAEANVEARDPVHRSVLEEILAFDGHARAGSARALKYFLWRQAVYDQLSDEDAEAVHHAQWEGSVRSGVADSVLLGGIDRAAKKGADLFGEAFSSEATLGDLVRIGAGDEDYPVGGIRLAPVTQRFHGPAEATLRAFAAAPLEGPIAPFRVQSGSRALRLVVFTDPVQSFTVHNFGQSDDPASPHYDDQARLLTSRRKVKPVYFERHELEGHIESEIMLRYDPSASD
jgi:penicillin amidase